MEFEPRWRPAGSDPRRVLQRRVLLAGKPAGRPRAVRARAGGSRSGEKPAATNEKIICETADRRSQPRRPLRRLCANEAKSPRARLRSPEGTGPRPRGRSTWHFQTFSLPTTPPPPFHPPCHRPSPKYNVRFPPSWPPSGEFNFVFRWGGAA